MFKKIRIILLIVLICIIALLLVGTGASAQKGATQEDKFPDRPINVIVGYGAGGSTDLSARILAQAAEKFLGVPIKVVNKKGGGGIVGLVDLKNAKNDGYTVGNLPFNGLTIVPFMQYLPYTMDDFDFLLMFSQYLYGLAVKSDSPYKTIQDFIKAARANPGMHYGCTGFPNVIPKFGLEKSEDIKLIFVPFASGPEGATALLGGHVDIICQNVSDIRPFLESGEMRLLASVGDERWDCAPEVPSLKELGYDIKATSYLSWGIPVGVPENRIQILREALEKAAKDPQCIERLKKIGLAPFFKRGDQCREFFRKYAEETKPLVEELGLLKK